MGRLESPTFEVPIGVRLSGAELALLLRLPCLRPEVEAMLIRAQSDISPAEVELTFYDLGELAGCVALEARHSEDRLRQRKLRRLFRHLTRLTQRAWREKFSRPEVVADIVFDAAK